MLHAAHRQPALHGASSRPRFICLPPFSCHAGMRRRNPACSPRCTAVVVIVPHPTAPDKGRWKRRRQAHSGHLLTIGPGMRIIGGNCTERNGASAYGRRGHRRRKPNHVYPVQAWLTAARCGGLCLFARFSAHAPVDSPLPACAGTAAYILT